MKAWHKAALAIAGVVVIVALGISVGSVSLSLREIAAILGHKLFGLALPEWVPSTSVAILWSIRLPRVLMAFSVGAMLSVSGAVMQSVLRNPLASSYTLGVSSGASVGAALVILTGFSLPLIGAYTLPLAGLVCGLLTVFASVTLAARVDRGMQSNTIILAGLVFSQFVSAILTLLYALANENLQRLIHWQMGSFSSKGWQELLLLLPVALIGMLWLLRYTRELDILTFGEDDALALGVNTRRVKWALLALTAALTGSAVAFVGIIGFIDLITPHAVRRVFGARHRVLLPMCALLGGGFMVLSDLVARTIAAPLELPVGAVTALVGAPFFAYVYFRRREGGGA